MENFNSNTRTAVYADLRSDFMFKKAFAFNNIAQLNTIPKELSENCFQKLFESAKIANFTANEQKTYLENQKMKYDYENVMEYAKEQAAEEGRAKGLAEGKRETAKNMLTKGFDKNIICEVTGLSQKEILSL